MAIFNLYKIILVSIVSLAEIIIHSAEHTLMPKGNVSR